MYRIKFSYQINIQLTIHQLNNNNPPINLKQIHINDKILIIKSIINKKVEIIPILILNNK